MSDNDSIPSSSDGDATQADLEQLIGGELEDLPPAPDGSADEQGTPDPEDVFVAPESTGPFADRESVIDQRTGSDEV